MSSNVRNHYSFLRHLYFYIHTLNDLMNIRGEGTITIMKLTEFLSSFDKKFSV